MLDTPATPVPMSTFATPSKTGTTGIPAATPGTPTAAIGRQGDVVLELRVDKATFLAGEGGPGVVVARNVGTVPVLLLDGCGWATILLLDEQGQFAGQPEWSTWAMSCPMTMRPLPPGAEARATVWFQVPRDAAGRHYTLQAKTELGAPSSPGGSTSTSQPFLTPPLQLTVAAPLPEHFLHATLEADRAGWRFVVADPLGRVPTAPHWMVIEAGIPGPSHRNWLADAPDGCWAGGWGEMFRDRPELPIVARAWLATPGYVVAAATQTAAPDPGTRLRPLGTPAARCVPAPAASTQTATP